MPEQTTPTLLEVIARLKAILNGVESRESVASWAATWVTAREPNVEDKETWKYLILAAGVDLEVEPTEYLHSDTDIQSWIEQFTSPCYTKKQYSRRRLCQSP